MSATFSTLNCIIYAIIHPARYISVTKAQQNRLCYNFGMLKIDLFGSIFVEHNEKTVLFPTEQARALLAYLVMNRKRPFPRTQLATLLWPELTEKASARNFRQTLLRLRRALGDDNTLQTPIILADRTTVQFNDVYPLTVDVDQFQETLKLVKMGPQKGTGDHRRVYLLEEATAVYRGEFLAGLHCNSDTFDEWRVMERERLLLQALAAWEQLADLYEKNGRYAEMDAAARQQIKMEAWREEAYQQSMQALWAMGKRTAALAQYETLTKTLQHELSVPPDDAITALRDKIASKKNLEQLVNPSLGKLPHRYTPFFGRKKEMLALKRLMLRQNERLVTLIGDGGVGKSRLAAVTGRQLMPYFPHGVWFVSMVGIHGQNQDEHESVAAHIGQTIGMSFQGTEPISTQLITYLQEQELLLILDNLEQIGDGIDLITTLLDEVPAISLLCTSRQPLYLQSEHRFRLDGLPLPVDTQFQSSAVLQLFTERAHRVGRNLSVADADVMLTISRLVDGLPLAIELIASGLDKMTLEETAVSIQNSYDALESKMRDMPSRHRSLRAVFDSSWSMLTFPEQTIFTHLSIFRGTFTADAAQAVCMASPADLNRLMEKSLLQQMGDDAYIVHERLRQYGYEQLAQSPEQLEQATAAHTAFYMGYLIENGANILKQGGLIIVEWLTNSIDNVQVAWKTAVNQDEYELVQKTVHSLLNYFSFINQYQELDRLYALASTQFAKDAANNPAAHRAIGWIACYHGFTLSQLTRFDEAKQLLDTANQIAQQVDDQKLVMDVAFYLTDFHYIQGDYATAEIWAEKTLTLGMQQENGLIIAFSYNYKGAIALAHADLEKADEYLGLALKMVQDHGFLYIQIHILLWTGGLRQQQLAWVEADDCYEEASQIASEFKDRILENASALELSRLHRNMGNLEKALAYVNSTVRFYESGHDKRLTRFSYERQGTIYHMMGDYMAALHSFKQSSAIALGYDDLLVNDCEVFLYTARSYLQLGEYDEAKVMMGRAEQAAQRTEVAAQLAETAIEMGMMALIEGKTAVSEQHLQTAASHTESVDSNLLIARLAHEQAQLLLAQGRWDEAEQQFLASQKLNHALGGMATITEDVAGALQVALQRKKQLVIEAYLGELLLLLEKQPTVPKGQRGLWSRRIALHGLQWVDGTQTAVFKQETAVIIEKRAALIPNAEARARYVEYQS